MKIKSSILEKFILNGSNHIQNTLNYTIDDRHEMLLWKDLTRNLEFENDKVGQFFANGFIMLFGMFAMYGGFYFVLNEYYLQTMEKRNCECSEIDKLKQLKYMLIAMILVWISLMIILYMNNTIIGPLVVIGLLLIAIHCIFTLIYYYKITYKCKCSVSRVGSITGFIMLCFILSIILGVVSPHIKSM